MSISENPVEAVDFNSWIAAEFAQRGAFTALVILIGIHEHMVTPLSSTYVNVIGDEIDWGELSALLASSGMDWDGASFFPVALLDNPTARVKLRELEARLDNDRLVLNEGHFFDKWGRRLMIEEITVQ